tara:strand:+ start:804 stop:1037 length:234 start_codon:yes stop_codon:yes gene_type:complete
MREYNGHRSWNAWNVALWLNNDYNIYNFIVNLVRDYGLERAIRIVAKNMSGEKTPDGATYNRLSVKLAIEGMEIEEE